MSYSLLRDRIVRQKPALPIIGPAGSVFVDSSFLTSVHRITDGLTAAGRSFKTPSSEQCCAWNKSSTMFYTTESEGTIRVWSFDASGALATYRESLSFINEPSFSQVTPTLIYGVRGHHVDQYDFTSKTYSTLIDVDALDPGMIPTGSYLGGSVQSSGGSPERLVCFYGGTSQDHHYRVCVVDKNFPSEYWILDTMAETIDGAKIPGAFGGGVMIHAIGIDRTGRYVIVYTSQNNTPAGIVGFVGPTNPNGKYQVYVWDVEAGIVAPLTWDLSPYGHDAMGYGVRVNRDAYNTTPYDAAQWVYRSLKDVKTLTTVIDPPLLPAMTYEADHPNWNNAQPDVLNPFVTAQYRYNASINTVAWRAWDDEVLLIEPVHGRDPWRVCHHRSDVNPDNAVGAIGFWYTPRPQISPDGQWILFTSNMEKSLGDDTFSTDATTKKRTDVFLVKATQVQRTPTVVNDYTTVKVALGDLLAQPAISNTESTLLQTARTNLLAAEQESFKSAI